VAIVSVGTLAVTDPGPEADAILDCIEKKVGEVDEEPDRWWLGLNVAQAALLIPRSREIPRERCAGDVEVVRNLLR